MNSENKLPAKTPIADATINAADAAANTIYLFTSLSVANNIVAN